MKNKKIIPFAIFLIILLSILIIPKEFQNDTFYLIKVGESIMEHGLDFKDHFSFHNLDYLYPHWLFSLIVYLVYNISSFTGLHILTIVFTVILGVSLYFVNIKNSKSNIISICMVLLTLVFLFGFLTLRSQILSYTIFILEYYFLNKLLKTNNNKYIIYIFLLSILLVNVHVAVYPFYLIMFLPILAEFIIKKILKKETYKIRKILIAMLLSILGGLISPLFINSYTYLYNTLINNTTNYIAEHQPTLLHESPRMILLVLIIIVLFTNKNFKLELKEKFLLLGLTYMAFSSIRHQSLLIIFTTIIANKYLGNFLYEKEPKQNEFLETKITSKIGIVISISLVLFIGASSVIKNRNMNYINTNDYPVKAVEYIKENLDYKNIRIFNDINVGSYLILNDIKVFVDSRTDLYTRSYNKKNDYFDEYVDIVYLDVYYEDIFDKYDIEYVLMPSGSRISNYLMIGNNQYKYTALYIDENFVLYQRNKIEG